MLMQTTVERESPIIHMHMQVNGLHNDVASTQALVVTSFIEAVVSGIQTQSDCELCRREPTSREVVSTD